MEKEIEIGSYFFFTRNVRSTPNIKAGEVCKLINITYDHIEVEYNGEVIRLRNIPERMKEVQEVAKELYND